MLELNNIWELAKSGFIGAQKRSYKQSIIFILRIFLILLICKIISFVPIYILDQFEIYEIPKNLNRSKFENLSDLEILLLISIYAPIVEELAFRLPLKFSKWNLIIASISLSLISLRIFLQLDYLYSLGISFTIGVLIYFIIQDKLIEFISTLWSKNKLGIFYFLLMIFSIFHLKNYEITIDLLIFSPFIILPRILSGIVYSYVRLSSGILTAIVIHALNNGVPKIILMIVN